MDNIFKHCLAFRIKNIKKMSNERLCNVTQGKRTHKAGKRSTFRDVQV